MAPNLSLNDINVTFGDCALRGAEGGIYVFLGQSEKMAYKNKSVKTEVDEKNEDLIIKRELNDADYKLEVSVKEEFDTDLIEREELIIKEEQDDIIEDTLHRNRVHESNETKIGEYLEMHALVQQKIRIHTCNTCDFQTRHRSNFRNHMLIHKDITEVKMFSCTQCTYQSRHKRNLPKHMLVHMDPSQIKMFSCDSCNYKSKYKGDIKRHNMLAHEDAKKVTMYSCKDCNYLTQLKSRLTRHMLRHKDISEVDMMTCNICHFQSKRRDSLQKHLLTHKRKPEHIC